MMSCKVHRDEKRCWKVIYDPDNLFTGNLFRLMDLQAGGFDCGTVFENSQNGQRQIVGKDGIARESALDENTAPIRYKTRPTLYQTGTAAGILHAA